MAVALADDGSAVLAGYTKGDWDGTNIGDEDFAAMGLDGSDGTLLWEWQVRRGRRCHH